tara:strand:+ start:221 stop:670 length:450 start_codon:yes stop_codon:yes gene_type:complete
MKLSIELVPKSSWYSNVRSNVTKSEWDVIRKKSYKKANYKCEICGDVGTNQGYNHPVECHEIWNYNDKTKTQTLTGLVSLCPNCHKVKHPGLAQMKGELNIVVNQLMKVNDMSIKEAMSYLTDSFDIWRERSKHDWKLDISYLEEYMQV